jgi:hypothetical protein
VPELKAIQFNIIKLLTMLAININKILSLISMELIKKYNIGTKKNHARKPKLIGG